MGLSAAIKLPKGQEVMWCRTQKAKDENVKQSTGIDDAVEVGNG